MAIYLKNPVHGLNARAPDNYYDIFLYDTGLYTKRNCPCPIAIWFSGGIVGSSTITANLAGRGRDCVFYDPYITNLGGPLYYVTLIDVWKAYAAGIWTSSVTITLFYSRPVSAVSGSIYVTRMNDLAAKAAVVSKSVTSDALGDPTWTNCASLVQKAVLTFNDNGTYSIA